MALKIFSVGLLKGEDKKEMQENENRLIALENKVNIFLEANKDYKKSDVLQSSGGASQFGAFTTISIILDNC